MSGKPASSDTLACRVWLVLAREGGWWRATEVRTFLKHQDINAVTVCLRDMVDRGVVKRRDAVHPTFGVTKDCMLPRGLTAEQLLSAMGAVLRAEKESLV
jgi:hypothetical protein